MNARLNQTTIERPRVQKTKLASSVQKQSPYIAEKKVPNFKNHQNAKNIPSTDILNSAIQLIHNLNLAIKQISIAPFIQNSLITSLNLYSDHLKKNLNHQSQPNIMPEITNKLKTSPTNIDLNLRNKSNNLQNPRRLATESNKSENPKTQKITENQNKAVPSKMKQNLSKVILPQIKKQIIQNAPEPCKIQVQASEEKDQIIEPEQDDTLSQSVSEKKLLNKTPKSRFFQLKTANNSYDQCIQDDEESSISPKVKQLRPTPLSKYIKNAQKYDEILSGLKIRLAHHVKLIEKLQEKIEEFETKKLGRSVPKVIKNKPKDDQYKPNQIQSSFNNKNAEQSSQYLDILKKQLQSRQQELKNLWIILLQQQSFPVPLSQ